MWLVPYDVVIYVSACLCIYIYHVFCCAYELMLKPLIIYNSSNSYGYSEFKFDSFSYMHVLYIELSMRLLFHEVAPARPRVGALQFGIRALQYERVLQFGIRAL